MRKRKWTKEQLYDAVIRSRSYRQVLTALELREAGGNYSQVKKYISEYGINIKHFTGKLWSKGLHGINRPQIPLEQILVKGSLYQSFKLKKRLFKEGLKVPKCEECGWANISKDGRVPLELDHINGNRIDNRFENLRILCPNCHSLKPTHRGRNCKKYTSN
ncbi:MAG: HNH endonuclease signature motif containing protein [Patescibacteria group bacterium]